MERAGISLAKLKLSGAVTPDQLACAAWPAAVGKRIASHATAKSLVRGSLIVEAEDAVWQKQLFYLRHQILAQLQKVLGNSIITDVEFRIGALRRPPQTAQALRETKPVDDADAIPDRGMQIVYKQARKKATA